MKLQYVEVKDEPARSLPDPYNLNVPFEKGWPKAKRRALVIIEHVSTGDLRAGSLLADELSHVTYENVLEYAKRIAKAYGCKKEWSFAFYNYNYRRTYGLDAPLARTANKMAAKRANDYIDKLDPDLIIVVGDRAAESITKNKEISHYRGWLHKHKGRKLVNTIDFDRAYSPPVDANGFDSDDLDDAAVDFANILGYVSRNIANGLIGEHPHDLSGIQPKGRLVTTIRAFDRMMRKLEKAKAIGVDTEGTSLETINNVLQTIQFSTNKDFAWIVPLMHKDAPWTGDELEYIKAKLYAFFSQKREWYEGPNTRYLIGQNFGYDIRMLMHWLNIRYWYWPTWDLQAGEYLLDENIKVLQKFGTPQYGLAQIFTNYRNDFYLKAQFSKKDRTRIDKVSLSDPAVIDYMAMDTQSMMGVHDEQLRKSSLMDHNKAKYTATYHRLVLLQVSSMIRVMSIMKTRGTTVDVQYLIELLKPNSPIVGRIAELTKEFYALPEVAKADAMLKKDRNIPTKSLFGGAGSRVFDMTKKEHMEVLYVKVLGLEPLSYGKPRKGQKEGDPSFDKFFLKAYMETEKACELHFRLNVLQKIKSSYVDAFYRHISNSVDSRVDQRIRPDFGYVAVVTGRSNSEKPSLQQIPEHSEDAKVVKRAFTSPPLTLPYEADYSAHEVRCWGIISDDNILAKTFRAIHKLIVKFRNNPSEKNAKRLEIEGDPHKVNYSFFTGVPIEKVDKTMRQDSKGITFGSMYGKGARALAKDIKKTLEEAEKIMARFFKKFAKAEKWLNWAVKISSERGYVYSPLGRRRHLFGYMSAHNAVIAAMTRRAKNSPIQGMASDICFEAADLFARALHECYEKLGIPHDSTAIPSMDPKAKIVDTITYQPTGPNAMVHDSVKGEARFKWYLMHLHLLEWAMTNGVADFLKTYYDLEINAPFDVEFEIGCDWSRKSKWNWTDVQLDELITTALEGHKTLYPNHEAVQAIDPAETLAEMKAEYASQAKLLRLDKRYPRNL